MRLSDAQVIQEIQKDLDVTKIAIARAKLSASRFPKDKGARLALKSLKKRYEKFERELVLFEAQVEGGAR